MSALDYLGNDIFLHIDKKSSMDSKTFAELPLRHSKLFIVPDPVSVTWGSASQIACELKLLKFAVNNGSYDYYSLISGADIPLMSQQDMHHFFEKHHGKEFVSINDHFAQDWKVRYQFYWPLREMIGRRGVKTYFLKLLTLFLLFFQKIFMVDRCRNEKIKYAGGANWFSITGDFAKYILQKEEHIMSRYKYTSCCDEIFLQTELVNSEFSDRVYDGQKSNCANMRAVDWARSNGSSPYTWEIGDYENLIHSGMLFARKIDDATENQRKLIDRIYEYIGIS